MTDPISPEFRNYAVKGLAKYCRVPEEKIDALFQGKDERLSDIHDSAVNSKNHKIAGIGLAALGVFLIGSVEGAAMTNEVLAGLVAAGSGLVMAWQGGRKEKQVRAELKALGCPQPGA